MDAKNYFEENKAKFADKHYNSEMTTEHFGYVSVSCVNCKSEREAYITLCVTDEKMADTEIEVPPEVAYWLGKCLIDFAENAVNLNNYYNQNSKADE